MGAAIEKKAEFPMRSIRVDKVTINIGCGGDEDAIKRAKKLLSMLTGGKKSIVTLSKRRSTFGVAKGKPVGVKTTLRSKDAIEFLKLALAGVDNKLKSSQFDSEGNFSFGVREYIELPGVKYNYEVGMMGFDVAVSLERPGFSISHRRVQKRRIPKKHKIKKEESIEWAKRNFGVEIIE